MIRKDLAHPETDKMALRTWVGSLCLRTQAAEEEEAGVQSASSFLCGAGLPPWNGVAHTQGRSFSISYSSM